MTEEQAIQDADNLAKMASAIEAKGISRNDISSDDLFEAGKSLGLTKYIMCITLLK